MTQEVLGFVDMEFANSFKNKAAMVLAFNQGKVLAVSRKNDKTKFGLAGGKVDPGETFIEAAIRECYEETGLEAFCPIPIFSRMEPGDVDFYVPGFREYFFYHIQEPATTGMQKIKQELTETFLHAN